MKKSLNTLSSTLISNGYADAAVSVNDLIKTLDDIKKHCHTKVAEESSSNNSMKLFMDSLRKKKKPTPSGSDLEKWNKILEDYDKVPYRVEKFHEITESIIMKVVKPFSKKKKDLEAASPTLTDKDKAVSTDLLSSQIRSEAANIPQIIKEASNRAKKYSKTNQKISISNNHIEEYSIQNYIIAEQFENLAINKFAAEKQGFWSKLLTGDSGKAAARMAGETPGFWARAFPIFGLLFSLPLALKNIHEAYVNGKKIAEELPLGKYNINKSAALTGNPLMLDSLISSIKNAIEENKDNPENLYELLDIAKTISAYWLDLIFAITNTLMLISDALELVAVLIDGPLPIGDAVGGFLGFFVAMGLMGIELASEHYVLKYWNKQTKRIKDIAKENVIALGGEVEPDEPDEPDERAGDKEVTEIPKPPEYSADSSISSNESMKLFVDSLR